MFKVDSAGIRKQLKWSCHTHTHTHTHTSSSIANLTASWYFIKIKYSEPNISAAASVSPLAFAVLLLAVIKQRCIAAGAPFWIGGELPVFVVRPHAPNRDACTVTVRYHSCQVRVLYATLGFFFCKVAGKNSWSWVAVFWAYFKRYGCLLGKSDKQLRFFIYVRHILQCIDWHSVCSQLIANQCNNIRAVE